MCKTEESELKEDWDTILAKLERELVNLSFWLLFAVPHETFNPQSFQVLGILSGNLAAISRNRVLSKDPNAQGKLLPTSPGVLNIWSQTVILLSKLLYNTSSSLSSASDVALLYLKWFWIISVIKEILSEAFFFFFLIYFYFYFFCIHVWHQSCKIETKRGNSAGPKVARSERFLLGLLPRGELAAWWGHGMLLLKPPYLGVFPRDREENPGKASALEASTIWFLTPIKSM